VVEAGDLGPRSGLRKAFEASKGGAAVACYSDDAENVTGLVRQAVKDAGLQIEPQAVNDLTARLGSDRLVTRSEIEKLILFKGGSGERSRRTTLKSRLATSGRFQPMRLFMRRPAGMPLGLMRRYSEHSEKVSRRSQSCARSDGIFNASCLRHPITKKAWRPRRQWLASGRRSSSNSKASFRLNFSAGHPPH